MLNQFSVKQAPERPLCVSIPNCFDKLNIEMAAPSLLFFLEVKAPLTEVSVERVLTVLPTAFEGDFV